MRLSNFADFAIVIMAELARHPAGYRLSAKMLAQDTSVPLPTTQKLLQRLALMGLLESVRGGGGGFALVHPPASVSLADIIEAVEGPIALTSCAEHDSGCRIGASCRLRAHWPVVNHALRRALAEVTLEQLAGTFTPETAPPLPSAKAMA